MNAKCVPCHVKKGGRNRGCLLASGGDADAVCGEVSTSCLALDLCIDFGTPKDEERSSRLVSERASNLSESSKTVCHETDER